MTKHERTGSNIWCVGSCLGNGVHRFDVFDSWYDARARFNELLKMAVKVVVWEV